TTGLEPPEVHSTLTAMPTPPPPSRRRWLAPIAAIIMTVTVTCAALGILMRWDRARCDVPFEYGSDVMLKRLAGTPNAARRFPPNEYGSDAMLMRLVVQTALEQTWYLHTPRLAAPDGLAMHDYPCADTLDILLVKVIGIFEHRPAVVLNLLY